MNEYELKDAEILKLIALSESKTATIDHLLRTQDELRSLIKVYESSRYIIEKLVENLDKD